MFTVNVKPKGFGGLPPRMLHALVKRVMLVFPLAWNRLYKAIHFTEAAKARYGYAPRAGERRGGLPAKGSYTAQKLRLYKHQLALVYTGRGMREALANNFASVERKHSGELRAWATLPRIFNLRNPQGRTHPAQEVTTVLQEENEILDGLAQQKLDAEFHRHSGFIG